MAAALRGEPGEIYNLASGVETSIRELAERINALTGNPTPIALAPARDWDRSGQRFGDPTKAREKLGWTPVFLGGDEYQKFLDEDTKRVAQIIASLGIRK